VMLIKRLLAPSKYAIFPALLWTFLIFFLCFKTIHVHVNTFPNFDKVVHFSFYFGFVFLWFRYLFFLNKDSIKSKIFLVLISILIGVFIEWAQGYFTTTRASDFWDVVANVIGSIFGIFMVSLFFNKK
jgi:VanZ family protein